MAGEEWAFVEVGVNTTNLFDYQSLALSSRVELDRSFARLYDLAHDEFRFVFNLKEVYFENFPGETFRVLKEKEVKQFGDASHEKGFLLYNTHK